MKKYVVVLFVLFQLSQFVLCQAPATADMQPPVAEKIPHAVTIHGQTRTDDYFWLREKNNPKVLQYLKAEDSYTEAVLQPTAPLQEKLYNEMLGHIKQTDVSAPYLSDGYFYYKRTEEGKQYPVFCRKRGSLQADEEIILDQNELAKGLPFLSIGTFSPSDDGNLLAYSTDSTGYRQYVLQIKDLRTGKLLPEKIERVNNVEWSTDGKTIFYVTEDAVNKRHNQLYRHTVGTERSDLIYEEKDVLFDISVWRTRDKQMFLLDVASKTSTEVRYLPTNTPGGQWKIILPREPNHEYNADHREGVFYIRSNKGATNFRLFTTPVQDTSEKNWKVFVDHRPEIKVEEMDLFANHLVLSEWEKGLQVLEVIDLKSNKRSRVPFPEPVYAAYVSANYEFKTNVLRYKYESLVSPPSDVDYNMDTGKTTIVKEMEVPGGFDKTKYKSERLFAPAADGTKVPVSIVYRKDIKLDGSAPLLLYAYGSYGYSETPDFSSTRLSLLDRGMIYAIAHIRGGSELGEEWRQQGRMMKKMNTFTDFIACAEHLIRDKYTSKERLVIEGGSAGGLLMGAVVNMRPDLFKAVVAHVPFVDVINTMMDPSLPLTTSEYIEWGNPSEKQAYDYMMQYSPYDNIKAVDYPSMLVKVSLNDSQVPYWEGTKFVAKLRTVKTDKNPLLLKVNFGAGHGGSSGRYDKLKEIAFDYAFMLWQVGLAG